MKILVAGDIAGEPGRRAFVLTATHLKSEGKVDLAIANAENAAAGRGLTAKIAEELFAGGADILTLGDHAWDQKEMESYLDREPRVIRPANFAPGCPGRGVATVATRWGQVSVINLVGRVFMRDYDCPFRCVDQILKTETGLGKVVLVDLHAEATSEKIVMGRYLDGRVTAVFGTHTHVQTSDEAILPRGTAYLTDLGMTGSKDSALGRDLVSVTRTFLTGMPAKFKIATGDVALEGILLDVDETTGRARKIKRLRLTEPF